MENDVGLRVGSDMLMDHRQVFLRNVIRSSAVALLLALILAACAGKTDSLPSGGDQDKQPGHVAPHSESNERVCLWLLWFDNRDTVDLVHTKMAQGQHFTLAARSLARQFPLKVLFNFDCSPAGSLDGPVAQAVHGLSIGQVSESFAMGSGWGLVMKTTDEYRLLGQKLYQEQRYSSAQEALLADLRLNPLHVNSWHLLALSRLHLGDQSGALEAFDQGLALTPQDSALLNDKATTLLSLGRSDEALEVQRHAYQLDQQNPVIMTNLAKMLLLRGEETYLAKRLAREAGQATQGDENLSKVLAEVLRSSDSKGAQLEKSQDGNDRSLSIGVVGEVTLVEASAQPNKGTRDSVPLTDLGQIPAPDPQPGRTGDFSPSRETAISTEEAHELKGPVKIWRQAIPQPTLDGLKEKVDGPFPPSQARQGQNGRFYVQVACFKQAGLAHKEKKAWSVKGYKVMVAPWTGPDGIVWQRVLMGPFPDRASAVREGLRLQNIKLIVLFIIAELTR